MAKKARCLGVLTIFKQGPNFARGLIYLYWGHSRNIRSQVGIEIQRVDKPSVRPCQTAAPISVVWCGAPHPQQHLVPAGFVVHVRGPPLSLFL